MNGLHPLLGRLDDDDALIILMSHHSHAPGQPCQILSVRICIKVQQQMQLRWRGELFVDLGPVVCKPALFPIKTDAPKFRILGQGRRAVLIGSSLSRVFEPRWACNDKPRNTQVVLIHGEAFKRHRIVADCDRLVDLLHAIAQKALDNCRISLVPRAPSLWSRKGIAAVF